MKPAWAVNLTFTSWGATAQPAEDGRVMFRGLMVGASNPKALLFFAAFFPQFIDP